MNGQQHLVRSLKTGVLIKQIIVCILFLFNIAIHATQISDKGNFALPDSQRPGPLFTFGQFVIDKNQQQLFVIPTNIGGHHQSYSLIGLTYVQGVTDKFSYSLTIPYATRFYRAPFESNGLSDANIEVEYVVIENEAANTKSELTIVSNVTIPSGSFYKTPPTGFGSPSLFLGTTYNSMGESWFYFLDTGMRWISPNHDTNLGNIYRYDLGLGKNLWLIKNLGYWFGLIELNAEYFEKDKIQGIVDQDSGGNILWIAPSLGFATKQLYVQAGVGVPISQQLNGNQTPIRYNASLIVGWTFD